MLNISKHWPWTSRNYLSLTPPNNYKTKFPNLWRFCPFPHLYILFLAYSDRMVKSSSLVWSDHLRLFLVSIIKARDMWHTTDNHSLLIVIGKNCKRPTLKMAEIYSNKIKLIMTNLQQCDLIDQRKETWLT